MDSKSSTKEGCFCPHGTILFNTVHDVCVTSCGKRRSIENLVRLGHGIFFINCCHTYKSRFCVNFRLCWIGWKTQTGEDSHAWHIHSRPLAVKWSMPCVWTGSCVSLLTSLVTHGQVTATPVCVTKIPWASSVSLFSAHQFRAPHAASPASSWSTRQTAAAQHSLVVSYSVRTTRSKIWSAHRLHFHGIGVAYNIAHLHLILACDLKLLSGSRQTQVDAAVNSYRAHRNLNARNLPDYIWIFCILRWTCMNESTLS